MHNTGGYVSVNSSRMACITHAPQKLDENALKKHKTLTPISDKQFFFKKKSLQWQ